MNNYDYIDWILFVIFVLFICMLVKCGSDLSDRQYQNKQKYIKEHHCVQAGITNLGKTNNQYYYKCDGDKYFTSEQLERM